MYYVSLFLRQRACVLPGFHKIPITSSLKPILNTNIKQIRSFSSQSDPPSTHFTQIKTNLSNLQEDLSFLTSSNIKSGCQLLELKFRNSSNSALNHSLSTLSTKGGELEKLVYRILDNRLKYNTAKSTKVAKESNYKYGIVGVSLICVFGSLSLSLHPLFLIGVATGLYFYRVVYRQSRFRKVTNVNLENLISENRLNKQKLSFLIKLMLYRLTSLEKDLITWSPSPRLQPGQEETQGTK